MTSEPERERKMSEPVARSWRLLPSERVLWTGGPRLGVPRDLRWTIVPGLVLALAIVAALFAGLLYAAAIPGVRSGAFMAFYLFVPADGGDAGVDEQVLVQLREQRGGR